MTTEEILKEATAFATAACDDYGFDADVLERDLLDNEYQKIEDERIVGQRRWVTEKRCVYLKERTFVAVQWDTPSTEIQEDDEFNEPLVYEVEPYASIEYVKTMTP